MEIKEKEESKTRALEEEVELFGKKSTRSEPSKVQVHRKSIVVTVQFAKEDKVNVKMFRDDTIEKLIQAICAKKTILQEKLKLRFEGEELNPKQQIQSLDIEDDDDSVLIDAVLLK